MPSMGIRGFRVGLSTLPTLEALQAQIRAGHPDTRKAAAIYLGKHGPLALPLLESLADGKDEQPSILAAAAFSLGNVGAGALPSLKKLAGHPEECVRWTSALALRKVGLGAIPTLEGLTKDPEEDVRWAATLSLGRMGQEALPALQRLVDDHCLTVAQTARKILDELEPLTIITEKAI